MAETWDGWLRKVESTGYASKYESALGQRFNSIDQVQDLYVKSSRINGSNCLDPQFFEDVGIYHARHKRQFTDFFLNGIGGVAAAHGKKEFSQRGLVPKAFMGEQCAQWLRSIGIESKKYRKRLETNFDSVGQIWEAYVRSAGEGVAVEEFFADIGIVDSSDKTKFHAWFHTMLAPSPAAQSRAPLEKSLEVRSVSAAQGVDSKWSEGYDAMPAMSSDGGSQEEFEEYWSYNNETPRRFEGGWVECRSHPQINVQPYWYNEVSGELSWHGPNAASLGPEASAVDDGLEELTGSGPEWEMSIKDLKAALAAAGGVASRAGLKNSELARRAVATYEDFLPRVLSWHDYQYLTFWFFGGLSKEKDGGRDKAAKSFFQGSAGRELFAEDAFFHEAARVMTSRLHRMPPINLTYFIWTYARPKIVVPEFMDVVGHHFCEGRIQMFDRCSLGTMVWNYSNLGVRHDRFFNECAHELSRPNRVRSLAPRNYQNSLIAYSRNQHWDERLFIALARGMIRLLDEHDPRKPKCERDLLFSYTCKDGSEVLADAFRINSLSVIYKALKQLGVNGPEFEKTVESFLDFARRSVERSPAFMREPGDACALLLELARSVGEGKGPGTAHMLAQADFQFLCHGAHDRSIDQLRQALRRAGLSTDSL